MKKILSILSLLLLCSTMAFADSERVKIAEMANGSVTWAINGQTVTLTATPADGYYLEGIKAVKTVDASAASRTRADIPVLGDYTLTKTSASADRSQTATYTLTLEEELGAYVTASFAARTAITATQVTLSGTAFTYNGSDQKATVTLTGLTSGTDCTVSYAETAWTNAGTYTVTVTGIDTYKGSVSKTWTIGKKALTITAGAKTITYGDAPANNGVTYNGFASGEGASVLGGTLDYDYNYTQFGNVGSYTITPSGLTSGNYDITFVAGTLTVEQKEVGLSWSNVSMAYDGTAKAPTAKATGTVNNDEIGVTISGAQTNVGDYTATATALTGTKAANYKLPAANTCNFTISKKALTITAEDKTKVFGEKDPDLTYKVEGLVEGEKLTGALTRAEGEGVGEYAITQGTLKASDNYTVTFKGAKLTITAATISGVTAKDYEGTYDGKAHTISVTAPEGTTVKYGTAEGTYTLDAAPTYTNAGEATVYYQVSKTGSTTVTGSAKVTISKKALTITAEDKTKVFGEKDPDLTYKVEGLVEGEKLTGALTRAEGEGVGEYAITQGTLKASDNYTVTFKGAKLTITAATISGVTAKDYEGTYDGKAHTISVTAPEGTTVKYGTAEGTYTLDAAPTYTNAGEATVYYQVSKTGSTTVTGSAKVTISKKALTITAEDKTKVFGEKDPALTYTVDGLVEGEKLTGALTRAEGEGVGEYAITQGTLKASDNYTVTFKGAKLTITAATISGVTAKDYEGTYDGKAHTISVTAPEGTTVKYGTAEGTYTLDAAPTYTNAGEATVYYQVSKTGSTTVTGSAKVTISKKALTITAEDKTKVFGEKDPDLTYKVEGLVEGEKLTGALTRAEGEGVGEYAITQGTLKASDNYTVTFKGAKLTITAKYMRGDANGDDKVDADDIVEIVNAIAGKPSSRFVMANADANGDGVLNIADILIVTSIIL